MKFDWMDKFIAEVPADWKPELEPMDTDQTLLGPVPVELEGAFRASLYGRVLAREVKERHDVEDHGPALLDLRPSLETMKAVAAKCKEAHTRIDMIKARAATLGLAALEAIRDAYNIPLTHRFDVREEGVVSWLHVDPEESLFELLGNLMGEDSPFDDVSVLRI